MYIPVCRLQHAYTQIHTDSGTFVHTRTILVSFFLFIFFFCVSDTVYFVSLNVRAPFLEWRKKRPSIYPSFERERERKRKREKKKKQHTTLQPDDAPGSEAESYGVSKERARED